MYFDPSKLAGGQTSIGTVEINSPAPAGGAVVTLGTSDTSLVTLPASVTVPEGTTFGTFTLSTSAVTSMTSVTIVATASGVGRTELITILPTSLHSLLLTPSSIGAGNTSTGEVTMSNPAPVGGALVTLTSSDTTVATVPATVTVPAGAISAPFSVNTATIQLSSSATIEATYGGDEQTATLRVFGANDVFATITPNGPPVTITTTNAGQNALIVFGGTAGQRVSLKMSGVTISSSYVSMLKPDGANLTSSIYVSASLAFLDTTILPGTGTYTILLDPSGTAVGSMTLQLYDVPPNVGGTITPGGTAVSVTTTVPGQNALLTFNGTSSEQVTVQITSNTMNMVTVRLLDPNGGALTYSSSSASSFNLVTQTLPAAGTYSLSIDPSGWNTGDLTLSVYDPVIANASNLAFNKQATQSSTNWSAPAGRAVDGNTDGNFSNNSVTHTQVENQAWWQVDLESVQSIGTIRVWNRTDCCGDALTNFYVFVSDEPFTSTDLVTTQNQAGVSSYQVPGQGGSPTTINVNRSGRYVRVQLAGVERLSLAEVQVLRPSSDPTPTPTPTPTPNPNLALNKTATQSSTNWSAPAGRAVDGNTDGNFSNNSVTHTQVENQAWWQVDLESVQSIGTISVWNRTDCCGDALTNFYVFVSDEPFTSTDLVTTQNQAGVSSYQVPGQGGTPTTINVNRAGRYVRVQLAVVERLSLAEVQVLRP